MRKVGQTGILANKNTRFGLIDKVAAAIILVMGGIFVVQCLFLFSIYPFLLPQ
jgi:hypothetical protein